MRKITLLCMLLLVVSLPLQGLAAQRLATVNYQKILQEAPQAKASRKLLDKEFGPLKKKLDLAQEHFRTMLVNYGDLGPGTNALQRANATEQLQQARKKLESKVKQYKTRLKLRKAQLQASFKKIVTEAVRDYAKQHDIAVALNDGIAFVTSGVDITDEILAMLKQDYRHAQAGSGGKETSP